MSALKRQLLSFDQLPGAPHSVPGVLQNMFPAGSVQVNPLSLMPAQVMTQQATRHARRVYVGGLPPSANEQMKAVACRYVHLRSQQLFERLVQLYKRLINSNYTLFKRLIDSQEAQSQADRGETVAAAYISSWFWDVYCLNRRSVDKVAGTALSQYYSEYRAFKRDTYDPFLVHLASVIKPTHIKLAPEDAIYIPLLCHTYGDWTSPTNERGKRIQRDWTGPFNINGWIEADETVETFVDIMNGNNSLWKVDHLNHDVMGRPAWLLDWKDNRVYAWFPSEGNYTREDLVAPYILGIPISPRLGPCDVDEWQFVTPGNTPAQIIKCRLSPRNFHGGIDYRTYETREFNLLNTPLITTLPTTTGKKRKAAVMESGNVVPIMVTTASFDALSSSSGPIVISGQPVTQTEQDKEAEPACYGFHLTGYQYRVIDWVYYAEVILELNTQKQNWALNGLVYRTEK